MGNRYEASDKNIHIIAKGHRDKFCDVCEEYLEDEKDTELMFDAIEHDYYFHICYSCLDRAVELSRKFR